MKAGIQIMGRLIRYTALLVFGAAICAGAQAPLASTQLNAADMGQRKPTVNETLHPIPADMAFLAAT